MTWTGEQCEICRQDCRDIADVVAYSIRWGDIVPVDLDGQQPWAGVQVAHLTCVATIHLIGVKQHAKERT